MPNKIKHIEIRAWRGSKCDGGVLEIWRGRCLERIYRIETETRKRRSILMLQSFWSHHA